MIDLLSMIWWHDQLVLSIARQHTSAAEHRHHGHAWLDASHICCIRQMQKAVIWVEDYKAGQLRVVKQVRTGSLSWKSSHCPNIAAICQKRQAATAVDMHPEELAGHEHSAQLPQVSHPQDQALTHCLATASCWELTVTALVGEEQTRQP